jgi:hypothetical protein
VLTCVPTSVLASVPIAADPSPWLQFFGRAHIVLLHSPLGLLPALAVLELGAAALRRPVPRGAIATLAWLCALLAAAAAASGLVLAGEGKSEGELLGQHKLLGITLGALCVALAVASCFARRGPFRILLLAALGVAVFTGHLGGSMTHGRDFLFEPFEARRPAASPPSTAAASAPATSAPAANGGTAAAPAAQPAAAPPPATADYANVVAPLLERTCTGCHNPDKKKGELVLTTPGDIRKGGENGAVLVPGKPDESPMVNRCELPPDHDDHMPPDGKPQPTPAEVAALRQWIAAGAPF